MSPWNFVLTDVKAVPGIKGQYEVTADNTVTDARLQLKIMARNKKAAKKRAKELVEGYNERNCDTSKKHRWGT